MSLGTYDVMSDDELDAIGGAGPLGPRIDLSIAKGIITGTTL